MLLINCKVELSLSWDPNCVLSNFVGASTFTITDAKLYVPIVTLSIEDNSKLSKLLSEGFKRSAYWNKYQVIPNKMVNITINGREYHLSELLDSNDQGVKRLFVLAYNNTAGGDGQVSIDSFKKYFLPRVKIENYNIEIDGRNFYDQPINDLIKQYDEIRKISTGQGDDYTTGCLLDFAYFKNNYRLVVADLSKQKALGADSRAIQQIIFTGRANAGAMIYYLLQQSKETTLQFSKGTTKVLQII